MSASGVKHKVDYNDATMANGLPSTRKSGRRKDYVCGIHGAMRERRGIKHGTVCARRRRDKEVIQAALDEVHPSNG